MRKLTLFLALLCFASCSSNQDQSDVMELFDAQTLTIDQIESNDSILTIVENNGKKAINVKSDKSFAAEVIINSAKDEPWDLSDSYQVKAEVTNTGKYRNQIAMFVGLDPDPLMRWYCSNTVDLEPGETKTVTVDLTWLTWVHDKPLNLKGLRGVPGEEKTDRSIVQQVSLNVEKPATEQDFTVNRVYAVGKTEVRSTEGFIPFVDTYGQYKHDDWKDKIHSDDEQKALLAREQEDLKKNPQGPDVNKYGGWTAGPKQTATGYFYPAKVGNNWWLVDPEGCLFWSAGVNCVNQSAVTSLVDREEYFEDLPSNEGAAKEFYGGRTNSESFNFFGYNNYRAFGDDHMAIARDLTHQRFASWGLNTIGFASDSGLSSLHKTPYVGSINIVRTVTIQGSEGYQGKFHDVFDPGFEQRVVECVERGKFGANDPWCIGYYVDNEESWGAAGSLSVATLISPADQPAKKEFVKDLKAKYKNIAALNAVWGSDYASWDDMLQRQDAPDEIKAQEDLYVFYEKLCNKYFKTVHDELERIAPHQLYLGCRLAWAQNDITMTAAATYCDVVSFNKYEESIEYIGLPVGVDRPIIIGEFHFGSIDRGLFHRGVKGVETQADRGRMYQSYIQGALRNNQIVGAHWFQYVDEPVAGRFDGENYSVGLVSTANIPFDELTGKIRETCYGKYTYRFSR